MNSMPPVRSRRGQPLRDLRNATLLALLASCTMAKGDPAAQPIVYQTLSPIEIRTHGLSGFQPILAQRLPVDRIKSQPSGSSAPAPRMAQLELLPKGYRLATIRISDAVFEDLDLVLLYRFNARDFELHGCGVYSSIDVESSGAWVQAYRSMLQLQIDSAEEAIHGKLGGSFLLGSKVIHVDPAVEFLIPRPTVEVNANAASVLRHAVWAN